MATGDAEVSIKIVLSGLTGEMIRDADALQINQPVTGKLAQGSVEAIVKKILKS